MNAASGWMILSLALSPAAFTGEDPPAAVTTAVPLPSGRVMTFQGAWKVEPALWGEHALLLGHGQLDVVEPGERTARELVARERMQTLSGWPVFGQDGRTVYKWLDQRRQLAAIDVVDGSLRTLSSIARRGGFFQEKNLATTPVYQGPAAVEDLERGRVWYVTSNRLWSGTASGEPKVISEMQITEGSIESWVYSAKRGTIYALANEDGWARLYVVRLDGAAPEVLDIPQHAPDRIVLSPDEDRLLIEHSFDVMAAIAAHASGVEFTPDPVAGGGFGFLHLDTGEIEAGPSRGREAGFTTNGLEVIYQVGWELRRYEIATRVDDAIAVVSSPSAPLPPVLSYYGFPVFSPDGRTFVVNVGEDDASQVIDLRDRRVFLGPCDHAWDFAWAPKGTRFRE